MTFSYGQSCEVAVHHVFVYYKVSPPKMKKARAAFEQVQSRLALRAGVRGYLLARPEFDEQGWQMWMETYNNVPSGFLTVLAELIGSSGLESWLEGPRHTEQFNDL